MRLLNVDSSPSKPVSQARPALSLRANFSWTFAGNVVYAACQWGMLVVLAKLGSPEMVGQFALGLAITAPLFVFSGLKLRAVQATDARREYCFGDYLSLRLIMIGMALLATMGIVLVVGYDRETALVILLIGLTKSFDLMSDIIYGLLQQNERMDRVAISRVIQGVLQIAALGATLSLTVNLAVGVTALAVASGTVTVIYDVRSAMLIGYRFIKTDKTLLPQWDATKLRRLTMTTVPLGITVSLGSLWANIPRYFIENHFGEKSLGLFAAVSYILVASSIVITAIGQSASPRLSRYYASGNMAAFDALLRRMVLLGAGTGLIGFVTVLIAGRQLLLLIYPSEYAELSAVLVWLTASLAIQQVYNFLGTGISAMRYFKAELPIQAGSCLVLTLLCVCLVGSYGLLGAAWSMLIANLLEGVAFVVVFRWLRRSPNLKAVL